MPNTVDAGDTPLHWALNAYQEGHEQSTLEMVNRLIEAKADLHIGNNRTVIEYLY